MSQHAPVPWPVALGVLLLCLVSCLIGIDHPLRNLNEGLYARIAQEMLDDGRWLVPTLNGVPYLEKPPLLYWLTALSHAAFGGGEMAARAAPLLGSVLSLTAVFRFARRHLGAGTEILAVLMFASAPITVVMGRTLLFDMLFTGCLAWALVLIYDAMHLPAACRHVRWSYTALGLAVMVKGLAALVLFGGIVAVHLALAPRAKLHARLGALLDVRALALLVLITVPWHVAAALEQEGFAWFYFVNEHAMRFLDARVPHDYHVGPWWYYLPRIVGYLFPWSLAPLLLLFRPRVADAPPACTFLWIAVLVPLVVFSLSGAKGDYYMLVAMPPLVLLVSERIVGTRLSGWLLAALPLSALGLIAWLLVDPDGSLGEAAVPAYAHRWLLIAALGTGAAILACARSKGLAAALLSASIAGPGAVVYARFLEANEPVQSSRSLAQVLESFDVWPVYLYRQYENLSALPYYLRRPVGVVASRSADLWYGIRLQPDERRFPSAEGFAQHSREERMVLVVTEGDIAEFQRTPLTEHLRLQGRVGPHWLFVSAPETLPFAAMSPIASSQ